MKIGQTVNFYRPVENVRKDAEVVDIEGAGESNAKLLSLRFTENGEDFTVAGVKHHRDAAEGEPFWLLKGVERAPAGWADVEPAEDLEVPTPVLVEEEPVVEEDTPRSRRRR